MVAPEKGNCRRLRKGTAVSEIFTFMTTRFETDDRLNLSGDTPVNDTPVNDTSVNDQQFAPDLS